jgi:VWFA-related protein
VPAAAAAASLSAALHSSPRQDAPAQQPPVFRTGTDLIRVDVTVIDRRGNPVTTLTADDFEVLDNGQPQPITSFKLIEATGQAPDDDMSLPIRNVGHAAAEAARDDVRVFLIFWDEYHIDPFAGAARARDALMHVVLEAFGPTDLVAFMDPLLPLDAIRFTRDRRDLADQVRRLRGRRGVYIPPRSGIEEAHLMEMRYIERIRNQVSVSVVQAAAVHLGTLRDGRKSLIVVSEGLGAPPDVMRDLIRAANDSNTAIYVVDPRGLQVQGTLSSFLQTVAHETGGEPLVSNDIAAAFNRVVKQSSAFYLIGYAMSGTPMDGRFHQIKVRVRRPGLDVRSRSGYWAPRATEVARAKAAAAAATPPPAVNQALSALPPEGSPHAIDLWVGSAPLGDGIARVTIAWSPREARDEGLPAPAAVAVVASSASAQTFEGRVDPAGTSFQASPGPLRLAVTVRDKDGAVIDREVRVVSVPEPGAPALALTTPVVYRARNPAELRAITAQSQPPVHAGRDFERTDRLLVSFATYGPLENGRIAAALLSRSGVKLADLSVQPDPGRHGYLIDVPLSSIARGEFVVSIEANRGSERTEALVAIRILH